VEDAATTAFAEVIISRGQAHTAVHAAATTTATLQAVEGEADAAAAAAAAVALLIEQAVSAVQAAAIVAINLQAVSAPAAATAAAIAAAHRARLVSGKRKRWIGNELATMPAELSVFVEGENGRVIGTFNYRRAVTRKPDILYGNDYMSRRDFLSLGCSPDNKRDYFHQIFAMDSGYTTISGKQALSCPLTVTSLLEYCAVTVRLLLSAEANPQFGYE
jgi:hypothetical protein